MDVLGAAKSLSLKARWFIETVFAFAELVVAGNVQQCGVSGPDVVGVFVEDGGKGSFFRFFALSVDICGATCASSLAHKHLLCLQ